MWSLSLSRIRVKSTCSLPAFPFFRVSKISCELVQMSVDCCHVVKVKPSLLQHWCFAALHSCQSWFDVSWEEVWMLLDTNIPPTISWLIWDELNRKFTNWGRVDSSEVRGGKLTWCALSHLMRMLGKHWRCDNRWHYCFISWTWTCCGLERGA